MPRILLAVLLLLLCSSCRGLDFPTSSAVKGAPLASRQIPETGSGLVNGPTRVVEPAKPVRSPPAYEFVRGQRVNFAVIDIAHTDGRLYVLEANRVRVLNDDGSTVIEWGVDTRGTALEVDGGVIYIAAGDRVLRFTTTGDALQTWDLPAGSAATGIGVGHDGSVLVADGHGGVLALDREGRLRGVLIARNSIVEWRGKQVSVSNTADVAKDGLVFRIIGFTWPGAPEITIVVRIYSPDGDVIGDAAHLNNQAGTRAISIDGSQMVVLDFSQGQPRLSWYQQSRAQMIASR